MQLNLVRTPLGGGSQDTSEGDDTGRCHPSHSSVEGCALGLESDGRVGHFLQEWRREVSECDLWSDDMWSDARHAAAGHARSTHTLLTPNLPHWH